MDCWRPFGEHTIDIVVPPSMSKRPDGYTAMKAIALGVRILIWRLRRSRRFRSDWTQQSSKISKFPSGTTVGVPLNLACFTMVLPGLENQ